MEKRIYEGYEIIKTCDITNYEIVLGEKKFNNTQEYAVWYCYDKTNYDYGEFFNDKYRALLYYFEIINQYSDYEMGQLKQSYEKRVKSNKTQLKELIGKKIKIINMEGEPQYTNKTGYVKFIDDFNQIHGTWGGCAIIPEIDSYEIIKEDK